jgi:hypothetical protein
MGAEEKNERPWPPELPRMSAEEKVRLLMLADRVRDVLESWKDVERGGALAACLALVGTEGGYEGQHTRERFLVFTGAMLGWAFDVGASVKKGEG